MCGCELTVQFNFVLGVGNYEFCELCKTHKNIDISFTPMQIMRRARTVRLAYTHFISRSTKVTRCSNFPDSLKDMSKMMCDSSDDLVQQQLEKAMSEIFSSAFPLKEEDEIFEPLMSSFRGAADASDEPVDDGDGHDSSASVVGADETEKKRRGWKKRGRKKIVKDEQPKKENSRSEYYPGEIVFAQIKGYPTWPARVI